MKIRQYWRNYRSVEERCPIQVSFEENRKELLLQFKESWEMVDVNIVLIDPEGNTICFNTLEITEYRFLAIPPDNQLGGEYRMCIKNKVGNRENLLFIN